MKDLPRATVPGKFVVDGRFSIVRRAIEIIQAECDKQDIDLSKYELTLSLGKKEN